MPTAPTPITPYATPPSSADPVNFDARADAKVADDVVKVGEYNALAANVYGNAQEAAASAATAATQRSAAEVAALAAQQAQADAAASAGAVLWVSGTTYGTGVRVWSPTTQQLFRRIATGAGTTDPAFDFANWARVWVEPEMVTAESFYF